MAACSKYVKRFRKALEFRKLPFPQEIIETMGKRAKSDRDLDSIIHYVCEILEPPPCQKLHCPHHTTYGFCGCSLSLVPGKCKLNLEYLKNKKAREEKLLSERLAMLPEKMRNINDDSKRRILSMSKIDWDKQVKRINNAK